MEAAQIGLLAGGMVVLCGKTDGERNWVPVREKLVFDVVIARQGESKVPRLVFAQHYKHQWGLAKTLAVEGDRGAWGRCRDGADAGLLLRYEGSIPTH